LSEPGSKSRYATLFYVAGALVHWASAKPSRIVSSSTEAEVHGLVHLGKENVWQREFHSLLNFFRHVPPTLVYQDNKSAIALSIGGANHKRSKHFGLEFDMFREYVALGEMRLEYLPTDDMVADLLTKPLPYAKFAKFRDLMLGHEKVQKHFSK
jgi:hypothetical protein